MTMTMKAPFLLIWSSILLMLPLFSLVYSFTPSTLVLPRCHRRPPPIHSTVPWHCHHPSPSPPKQQSRQPKILNVWRSMRSKVAATDEVALWRLAAVSFISSALVFRNGIDTQLIRLWTHLTTSSSLIARIFRTDSYEWVLAVMAFGVFIHFFGYADQAVREASQQGRIHPWKQYRLQDRFEADKHRRMIYRRYQQRPDSNNGQDVDIDSLVESTLPPVNQSPWHWQAWRFEFWVYVLPLLTWDILSPRRFRRIGAFAAPSTLQIMRDVTCGLVLYDALFFAGHFLMHKIPRLYHWVHRKHHVTEEVRACDIVRLSLAEEVLEVGFSIVALNVLGAHPVARSLYNLVIVFLLTELHSGFDFPWTPQNVVPFGLATGSRRHHYHHRFGQHYYQKFFCTWDRICGFVQRNDGSLKGDSVQSKPYIPAAWKSVTLSV